MPEMRETRRVRYRTGKGLDWFSATSSKREDRGYLHGLCSEEKVTLRVLLRSNLQGWTRATQRNLNTV